MYRDAVRDSNFSANRTIGKEGSSKMPQTVVRPSRTYGIYMDHDYAVPQPDERGYMDVITAADDSDEAVEVETVRRERYLRSEDEYVYFTVLF